MVTRIVLFALHTMLQSIIRPADDWSMIKSVTGFGEH